MLRSFVLAAVLGGPALALADTPAAPPPRPGFTLPAGKVNLALNVEIEMSTDREAEPLSFAPDASYGVSDDLTVALVHSSFANTGFRAKTGSGLCVTGTEKGCVALYNNVGAEAWYRVSLGEAAAAAVFGLHAVNLDAGYYALKLGFRARHTAGKVAITGLPSVFVALTERTDDAAGKRRNKDTLWVPVQLTYRASDALTVGVGSGIKGPLQSFGDAWQVPLGFMGQYAVDRQLSVGASWVFGQLLSGATDPPAPAPPAAGVDYRGLQVWASYTM